MLRKKLPIVFVSVAVIAFCGVVDAGAESFEESHTHLYSTGEVLRIGHILELDSFGEGSVVRVSFRYNMVRSTLQVEWLYDGEIIGQTVLTKGQQQSASFEYGKRLPASIGVRFVGPAGYVQVLAVKVDAAPPLQVTTGTGVVTAGGGAVVAGDGVSPAQTPTPRQLDMVEPAQILPVDPEAVGFDESQCERLICVLPPNRLRVGDSGQQRVSSFYLYMARAPKAAREEMPASGQCAYWDRPMTDDDPSTVLVAEYNTRIDIYITWEPEITYSLRPHLSNVNYEEEGPARFIRLWDTVMAGGWLDVCVKPRTVYSVSYNAVIGQY
jgi:hypothetical protein